MWSCRSCSSPKPRRLADVVLPVQSFIEREGTFTSGERRVQRFYPAVAAVPRAAADFRITAEVAERLGLEVEGRAASLVMASGSPLKSPDYAGLDLPEAGPGARTVADCPPRRPVLRWHVVREPPGPGRSAAAGGDERPLEL